MRVIDYSFMLEISFLEETYIEDKIQYATEFVYGKSIEICLYPRTH